MGRGILSETSPDLVVGVVRVYRLQGSAHMVNNGERKSTCRGGGGKAARRAKKRGKGVSKTRERGGGETSNRCIKCNARNANGGKQGGDPNT